jgi:hypothetical protein
VEPNPPLSRSSAPSAIGPWSTPQFTGTGSVWPGKPPALPRLHPV